MGDKTLENFQTFFQDAQMNLRKERQATTQKTGYHGMNAMVPHGLDDTNEAIINMSSAALLDKETIASQKGIIERLTEIISTLTVQLSGTNRATETGKWSKWVNGKHVLDRGSYF